MTDIAVCLFNFENGGRIAPGQYDFSKLRTSIRHASRTPDLLVLCEAKEWGYWGKGPLYTAASSLSDQFKVPYETRLAHIERGDFAPAVFFNRNLLEPVYWGNADRSVPQDKRNLVGLRITGTNKQFEVLPEHWDFTSGIARMPYAGRIASYGDKKVPVLVAGDKNETASGLHLPQIDWEKASAKTKQQKGKERPDGTYGPHTDAIDSLIGKWDERFSWGHKQARRINGRGFHLVPELAAKNGTPPNEAFVPTTVSSGLLIDMMLINEAWLKQGGVKPRSYRVVGAGIRDWPSNHLMVEATLIL